MSTIVKLFQAAALLIIFALPLSAQYSQTVRGTVVEKNTYQTGFTPMGGFRLYF